MTPRIANRNLKLIPLLPFKDEERDERETHPLMPIPSIFQQLELLARSKLRVSVSTGEETMPLPMP